MLASVLRVLTAAALHKKEKFHLFDRSSASKRMRNRLYYAKNKARIKAHRKLYRLKHRYHDQVDKHIKIVRPSWSIGQETRNQRSAPTAVPQSLNKHTLSPSAPRMYRAGLPTRRSS